MTSPSAREASRRASSIVENLSTFALDLSNSSRTFESLERQMRLKVQALNDLHHYTEEAKAQVEREREELEILRADLAAREARLLGVGVDPDSSSSRADTASALKTKAQLQRLLVMVLSSRKLQAQASEASSAKILELNNEILSMRQRSQELERALNEGVVERSESSRQAADREALLQQEMESSTTQLVETRSQLESLQQELCERDRTISDLTAAIDTLTLESSTKSRGWDAEIALRAQCEADLGRVADVMTKVMQSLGVSLVPPSGPGMAPLLAFFADMSRKLETIPRTVQALINREAASIAGVIGYSILPRVVALAPDFPLPLLYHPYDREDEAKYRAAVARHVEELQRRFTRH